MRTRRFITIVLLPLLLVPAAMLGQEQPAERGSVEFGVRYVWGDVYGRPDLPFRPDLFTAKFNENRDIRTGFFVPKFNVNLDDVLGSKNYLKLQAKSSVYRDQSYLVTFGQYRRFKVQFRYDQIPHIFTNTARTLFTEQSPGVLVVSPALKTVLQTQSSTGTAPAIAAALPSFINTQIVPDMPFLTPRLERKAFTLLAKVDVTPDWNISATFAREKQVGSRPISLILYTSPSASASTQPGSTTGPGSPWFVANRQSPGTGVELPEPIDYFNDLVRIGTEYGKERWAIQAGYTGSFFHNNIDSLLFDNPFATADLPVQLIAPAAGVCVPTAPAVNCAISAVPAHGQMDLYPDNQAHYLNFAAAFDLADSLRVMGTVNPGWLRQNDAFLPYTANTAITGLSPLPATSLGGSKRTLAMNWTLVGSPLKVLQLTAKYRHYDYNNHTPMRTFTPVIGDVIAANSTATAQRLPAEAENDAWGYNRKTLELAGNWFLGKRSSVKAGYEAEWLDRVQRDVEHSLEHSFFVAADLAPHKDLLFRVSYRHSDRKPDHYEDDHSLEISGGIPEDHPNARRFDETARLLNRGDVLVQYNVHDFTFSGSFQTTQIDTNRPLETNSTSPLNFLTGAAATVYPYYLYGALKDLSFIYTANAAYSPSPVASLFVEYTRERYHKRMVSRYRVPESFSGSSGCGPNSLGQANRGACDTPNNDWLSSYRDVFDTYATGVDLFLGKKVYLTTFYSLSAGRGEVLSAALGDPTITTGVNRFILTSGNTAQDYPDTVTRIHEMAVILKYKIRNNVTPKLEYRYQQFDSRDYQTTPMTQYMGCIGTSGTPVTGCPSGTANLSIPQPSAFYPFFVVGDTSAARFLFLGADQPSYGAHYVAATLEYHF